jgi:glycogen operon protein
VELAFFDREDDAKPSRVIALDPVANRTYHYWHVFLPGVRPGQICAYRLSTAATSSGAPQVRWVGSPTGC